MASEIRVDKITSLSGVGTITPSSSGIDITGITTVATLKATTGIVTTLTATTGIVTTLTANTVTSIGAVSGTTGTFSGAVSGTTGTFTGDVDIADKIVHTGDTNTAIRFPAADTITAETGGSERTRVDSSGRFGIGTNNPDSLLHVYGATIGYAKIETGDGGTNPIIMHKNPDRLWHAGLRGDASDGYVIRDATASSNRLTIDTSGNVTVGSGNLVIGTSGKGIDFSATSDGSGTMSSELLDDYEEGTFTPTLYYVSGTSGVQYNTQEARYTKIGRLISFQIRLALSNKGSGNNNVRIGGLPFTPEASGVTYDYMNIQVILGMNIGAGRVPFCQMEDYGGGGRITLYSFDYASSSNYAEINSSNIDDNFNFGMTGIYVSS